ncbi:Cell division control protein 48-like C [Vitis vinifera]|uniref:Cell division control protein 48-like C n=1 Tax=Vitis vinifera TaxID=29760 RepID=A0A438DIV3_VITVI|nr:Cell division control protein 48-like C [Vitis vinifera]
MIGFDRVLVHRLQSCKDNYQTLDAIINHLCRKYPEYSRKKRQPFTRLVQQALVSLQQPHRSTKKKKNEPLTSNLDDDNQEFSDSARTRIRIVHPRLRIRIRIRIRVRVRVPVVIAKMARCRRPKMQMPSMRRRWSRECDLMKEMMRATYAKSASKNVESKNENPRLIEDKNIELEVGDKQKSKIGMVEGGGVGKGLGKGSKKEVKGSVSTGVEVSGKDGPMFSDLGGMKSVVEDLKMEVIVPLYYPELPRWLGVRPMAGILLHGPPGCGKTKLAHAIANETKVPFYKISATEVVSGVSGASEENIRELFSKAYRTAPSIVFIDEIDAIASKRENLNREMERRIVTQLMTCMDESNRLVQPADGDKESEISDHKPGYVLVIGATNRPDAVDPALRRPGRFDREIALGVPDESARADILSVITRNLRLEGSFDLAKLARSTPGFVGADLAALANKAGNLAMKRIIDRRKFELSRELTDEEHIEDWWRQPWLPEEMEKLSITMADFEVTLKELIFSNYIIAFILYVCFMILFVSNCL